MLVLTRKSQERILIGEDITVTVVRVQGQSVRIGIDAPPEVAIRRGELASRGQQPGQGRVGVAPLTRLMASAVPA